MGCSKNIIKWAFFEHKIVTNCRRSVLKARVSAGDLKRGIKARRKQAKKNKSRASGELSHVAPIPLLGTLNPGNNADK